LFCFASLDNSPATTTLPCSYWTYGIRVIFSVTARITTNINTKTNQKISQHVTFALYTFSGRRPSSHPSSQRGMPTSIPIPTADHFRKPFLITQARTITTTTTSEPELERSSIAKGRIGWERRAGGFRGRKLLLFLWNSFLRIVLLPHYFKSRIYPHLLRSCRLLHVFLGFLGSS
jgi:hypothetical protein